MAQLGPVGGTGADAAVSRESGPLQLALVLGFRQRRTRQQRHPSDRRSALGHAQEAAGAGAFDRRPLRLQGPGADAEHAERHLDVRRRLDDRRAAAGPLHRRADVAGTSSAPRATCTSRPTAGSRSRSGGTRSPSPRWSIRPNLDHFQNFADAIRARDPKLLHAEIEETSLSTALCHLGNISYRVGRELQFDPAQDAVRRRRRSEQAADARVSQAVRRAGQSLNSHKAVRRR